MLAVKSNVVIAAAALMLAACGGSKPSSDSTASVTPAGAGSEFRIAMIAKSSSNPVFLSGRKGAEDAAAELTKSTGVRVTVDWFTPPSEDATVQAQRISEAVNSGANAILLSATDAGKLVGAVDDAVARGVPVMTFDSDVPTSKRFSFYGANDSLIGVQVMAELARQLGGKGRIGIIAGNQNAPNLQMRVAGVKAEAKKTPGITIVSTFYHPETGQDAAAEVIRAQNAYPDITGWAMIGGWPLFTNALLTDLDPQRVKVVSVDALPVELAYVDRGIAPVLFAQPTYLWGYTSVKTIFDKVHDGKDVPPHVQMELVRVDRASLGKWARQLKDWGFTDVDPKYLTM